MRFKGYVATGDVNGDIWITIQIHHFKRILAVAFFVIVSEHLLLEFRVTGEQAIMIVWFRHLRQHLPL
jgi:hypothetical protein